MVERDMSEQTFLMLVALEEKPRHGYGVVQRVLEVSEGRVRLRVGTLYGVLDRLVADGWAEHDREEIHQGRLRRYYRLTGAGSAALVEQTRRLAANVDAASTVLRARGQWPRAAEVRT
ncbi:PadR family transcriptional regulator [Streptomyces sp. MN03-5084-2B]|nr:PadR family transcriptional regulator [Streptomyces sp. MN03-5084-2B]